MNPVSGPANLTDEDDPGFKPAIEEDEPGIKPALATLVVVGIWPVADNIASVDIAGDE